VAEPLLPSESATDFERRFWRVQRVAWIVLGLVIVAALLGLLGKGPLSRREERSGDLSVRYDRFVHRDSPAGLVVELPADADGVAALWIGRSYLENVRIQRTTPEAESTWAGIDRSVFAFHAEPRGRAWVSIDLEVRSIGRVEGWLGAGSDSIPIRQFVYP
jgi:protein-L-isoaspartate(D-aspartate) O-methyltransferase